MNCFTVVLFWSCIGVVVYTYFGYALILHIVDFWKKNTSTSNIFSEKDVFEPAVTLVIAAYNEEDWISAKIENCLQLNYPRCKLDVLFVTDGSTDNSVDMIVSSGSVRIIHQSERKGKSAALNRAMAFVRTPIVIFSDANTMLNEDAIKNIVRHYVDPCVGGVSGEKRISNSDQNSVTENGEGRYWKYESWLKKTDSCFYSVIGAAGELFSIRSALYVPLDQNIILDDFMLSMQVAIKGFLIKYEPEAYGIESGSANMKEESKRKIRISSGAFQAICRIGLSINPFNNFKLFYLYFSHRVFRWTICPLALVFIFTSNLYLSIIGEGIIYNFMLVLQVAFYFLAFAGSLLGDIVKFNSFVIIPQYFVFMNINVIRGFFKYLSNSQSVTWDKVARRKVI